MFTFGSRSKERSSEPRYRIFKPAYLGFELNIGVPYSSQKLYSACSETLWLLTRPLGSSKSSSDRIDLVGPEPPIEDHTHTYRTGKSSGQNNTEAESGLPEVPLE